jgi:lipoate-protein ligase B
MDHSVETIRFPEPVPYNEAHRVQTERRVAVEEGRAGNALLLLEHEPVITLGRSFRTESLLRTGEELAEMGVDLVEADRGGDATYHGPGQMVAYPVLNLREWRPSIGWYLRSLEQVLIGLLAVYGLEGERLEGYTGVWVAGAKVAAIGVGLHNWVTFHGVSLNVDPDMTYYELIVPCGIPDKPVTCLRELLGRSLPMEEVMDAFDQQFRSRFLTSSGSAD